MRREAAYLVSAVLVVTAIAGGAVVANRVATGTNDSASQEGTTTMTSSEEPAPSDEPLLEEDYDPSAEDPFIDDGEPETYEEFARDAAAGQNPNDMPPVAGGGSITVTERESEPPR